LFRSRDGGATWTSANRGTLLSGALTLAINPTDVNHLLLGTESGLWRSANGGRDWTVEAPSLVLGAVFAVAFAADGHQAWASTSLGLFRGQDGTNWQPVPTPRGSVPARAILTGETAGRVYLAGQAGVYRSDDGGSSWSSAADELPQGSDTPRLIAVTAGNTLHAIVQGRVWTSHDGARHWASQPAPQSVVAVDTIGVDPQHPRHLWVAAGGRLFSTEDDGKTWHQLGQPMPEPNTTTNGVIASETALVLTTDRGLYRTTDTGTTWTLLTDNLPAHMEAGALLRDPDDPATLYAAFSLIPYSELWRRAANRQAAFEPIGTTELLAGAVFLVLLFLGAAATLRALRQYYRPSAATPPSAQPRKRHQRQKEMPSWPER